MYFKEKEVKISEQFVYLIKPEGIIHLQKDKSNINYSLLCNSKHLTFIAAWNTKGVILQNVQTALIH